MLEVCGTMPSPESFNNLVTGMHRSFECSQSTRKTIINREIDRGYSITEMVILISHNKAAFGPKCGHIQRIHVEHTNGIRSQNRR